MASTSIPRTMKAITTHGQIGRLVLDRAVPSPRPDQLLVKVHSVALNPTDWKHLWRNMTNENSLLGCDYSGTVVSVGSAVTKSFKAGDRIAGVAHGANSSEPTDGAFAEYITVKGDVAMHIPSSLPFEAAATFPLGLFTVDQGLFQKALKLNLPTNPTKNKEFVLIYGGSSATGSLGIQFAREAGYRVITTCSPKSFPFVESLGAEKAFDYKSANVAKDINAYTSNNLKFAWDTISIPSSAKIVADALSSDPSGAKSGTILPEQLPRDDVKSTSTFMYTIFGDAFVKGGKEFPAAPEDFESAKNIASIAEKLLAEGKLKTHPEKVGKDGLKGVLQGLLDLKNERVSAAKLVYRVSETPEESVEESFA